MAALRDREAIPAVSAAVGWAGQVRRAAAVGTADLEARTPATTRTLLRAGEITQAFTAVAVMQQVDNNALDLGDDIGTHVPEFPARRWPITIEQLLWHGGGIRPLRSEREAACGEVFEDLVSALRPFATDPLRFRPGTRCVPTPYGYTLVGRALETVTGRSYERCLHDQVIQPAGLVSTRLDRHFEVIAGRARGYVRLPPIDVLGVPEQVRASVGVGGLVQAPLHDGSLFAAGAGLLSTPSDLVRFGLALLDGELLSEDARRDMWTARSTATGLDTGTALGWLVRQFDGKAYLLCTGQAPGFTAALLLCPADGTVVAVMANLHRASGVTALARQLLINAHSESAR